MDNTQWKPPYLAAMGVFALVLTGYVLTLAPTVTFWDAGELIAAVHTLGIPHPPGTPLFVLLGHVWSMMIPLGEVAWRLNLMSATFSAAGAAFFFLVVHYTLVRVTADLAEPQRHRLALGGAAAAAVIGAFTFTNWQNSVETEAYSVATFTIAAICWASFLWRHERARGGGREARWLMLIVYLAGISMGNHLLALLSGPAVVAFMSATLLKSPAADPDARRHEWAHVGVVAGVWALLIGTGLGNTTLTMVGGVCFLVAAGYAMTARALPFAILTLVVASVGMTTYLFLWIRAGQNPIINEADPSTFSALLDVIRRAQYPPRTPFDDPTVMSGPGNPGRNLNIMWLQVVNYIQYFSWQFGRAIDGELFRVPLRVAPMLLFFTLGAKGMVAQWRADRPSWWLLTVLWLTTGIALMGYMNFRPGHSIGFDLYPLSADHEVRERDYFFVVSFVVWGLWAGIGLTTFAREALTRLTRPVARVAVAGLAVLAVLPVVGNAAAATRRHGPEAMLAADVAFNLLNSVPPYGILFTYGDNDTFPLWWAQEVAGIRRDVTVVCIALAQTSWYARQLRDNPIRPFDEAAAPPIWQGLNPQRPTWPTHTLTDQEIQTAAIPRLLDQPVGLRLGPIMHTLPAGTPLYLADVVLLRILQQNLGRRPVAWSITAGSQHYNLDRYLLQQGLVQAVQTAVPDTTQSGIMPASITGSTLDVPTTERLAWDTYRYAGLLDGNAARLDDTNRNFSASLSLPFTQLAYAFEGMGDYDRTVANLERAATLSPNPAVTAALRQLQFEGPPAGDSPAPRLP